MVTWDALKRLIDGLSEATWRVTTISATVAAAVGVAVWLHLLVVSQTKTILERVVDAKINTFRQERSAATEELKTKIEDVEQAATKKIDDVQDAQKDAQKENNVRLNRIESKPPPKVVVVVPPEAIVTPLFQTLVPTPAPERQPTARPKHRAKGR